MFFIFLVLSFFLISFMTMLTVQIIRMEKTLTKLSLFTEVKVKSLFGIKR